MSCRETENVKRERDLQCLTFHLPHLIRGVTLWSSGLWLLSAVITPPQHRKLLISQTALSRVCVCVGKCIHIEHMCQYVHCVLSQDQSIHFKLGRSLYQCRHFAVNVLRCLVTVLCVRILGSPLRYRSSEWLEWDHQAERKWLSIEKLGTHPASHPVVIWFTTVSVCVCLFVCSSTCYLLGTKILTLLAKWGHFG